MAYQMNRPLENDGIIIAFRRADCEEETIEVNLGGLDKEADYELFFEDYGLRMIKDGSDLIKGLVLTIPNKPSSLLVSYHKK
jgi:alpha-galactosidase